MDCAHFTRAGARCPETQHLGDQLASCPRPPPSQPQGRPSKPALRVLFSARTVGALFPGQGFQEATRQTTRVGWVGRLPGMQAGTTPGLHLRPSHSRWSTDQGRGEHGKVCSEGSSKTHTGRMRLRRNRAGAGNGIAAPTHARPLPTGADAHLLLPHTQAHTGAHAHMYTHVHACACAQHSVGVHAASRTLAGRRALSRGQIPVPHPRPPLPTLPLLTSREHFLDIFFANQCCPAFWSLLMWFMCDLGEQVARPVWSGLRC